MIQGTGFVALTSEAHLGGEILMARLHHLILTPTLTFVYPSTDRATETRPVGPTRLRPIDKSLLHRGMARLQRPKLQTSANLSPTATPACGLCSESLKISEDKLKTYNRFYKNCKSCRNKKQEYNRRVSSQSLMARKERKGKLQRFKSDLEAREQNGSITQPFFIADSDSNSSTKEKTPAAFGPSDTAIGPEVIDVENLHTGPADGPLTPPPTQQECSVCAEEYPIRDFPKLEACTHETDICHTCFLTWLDQQLSSTTWEQFTCPSSNCKNRISHHDVKALAPMDVYTRYVLRFQYILIRSAKQTPASMNSRCDPSLAPIPPFSTVPTQTVSQDKSTILLQRETSSAAMRVVIVFVQTMTLMFPSTKAKHVHSTQNVLPAR